MLHKKTLMLGRKKHWKLKKDKEALHTQIERQGNNQWNKRRAKIIHGCLPENQANIKTKWMMAKNTHFWLMAKESC